MSAPGWWRRNRWGLVALPVAAAAALAASSYRVEDYWWLEKPRDLADGSRGEWVEFSASQYDRTGDVPFTVRVRLDEVRTASAPFGSEDPLELPDGVQAVAVDLTLAAAPDVPLAGCSLVLRDADGTEYEYQSSSPSISQATSPCVPPDARGPELDLFEGLDPDTGPRRPDEWAVSPVVLLPEGVEVTQVLLSWGPPDGLLISAG
ncbi:hypothetical protein [Jiangella anatolica]|uniref:DUF4352 domain-containing protein n=1 Tax=Jiangella anatolica TaxID=2670374 RepID=A0A2W2B0A9_9ACTN|nr:hypothetical protein [Jiangella anatolica]PZF80841.1 hypothetical protein C1I92_24065 [Jiangella anatolica]